MLMTCLSLRLGLGNLSAGVQMRHIVGIGLLGVWVSRSRFSLPVWVFTTEHSREGLLGVLPRLKRIAQGGTAVGTGVNTHPMFAQRLAANLERRTGIAFRPAGNFFAALSSQDTAIELSGQLRVIAVGLLKIVNDLRWMNSGPLHGLAENRLPALQPGRSLMPGKINPVIPEVVAMACVQVMGNDAAIMGRTNSSKRVPISSRCHNLKPCRTGSRAPYY